MFLEPLDPLQNKKGWIEVVCGCMFSGKTEELIRRLKRARIASQRVIIFKPKTDTRYHEEHVVSHDSNAINSTPIKSSADIPVQQLNADVVGIDEAQFFDEGLPEVCRQLANNGIRVVIAGLDMDFKGVPFGPMPQLMAMAEFVTKVQAICVCCGSPATHSYRTNSQDQIVMLGERDLYEPRCRTCFNGGEQVQRLKSQDSETDSTPDL